MTFVKLNQYCNILQKYNVAYALIKGVSKADVRLIDKINDSKILSRIDEIRNKLPSKLKKKFNFAYAQADIDVLDKNEFFSHSKIQSLDDISDEVAARLDGISLKPENQQFETLNINKDNVVDGINSWNRNVDTEFKIIEDINGKLGNNVNAKGNITLYTDLYPCPSCQYVVEQFMEKYPNIKVDIIYKLD